jgi:hypothetical protein
MRTALNIDDELMVKVKKKAIETGKTITEIVEEALREETAEESTWPRAPCRGHCLYFALVSTSGSSLTETYSIPLHPCKMRRHWTSNRTAKRWKDGRTRASNHIR